MIQIPRNKNESHPSRHAGFSFDHHIGRTDEPISSTVLFIEDNCLNGNYILDFSLCSYFLTHEPKYWPLSFIAEN